MSQRVELINDKNPILCRAVRKFPVVYDRAHKDYNNKDVYDEAWASIAIECEDTVNTCKSRWKSIRDNYMRSARGSPKKRSSNRIKDNYLADLLDFLVPHVQTSIDNNDIERFENLDPINKEKDARKSKSSTSKLIDPLSTGAEPKSLDENHSLDTYMVTKKSTKEGSTLVLKKTSDIKKLLDIDKDDEENKEENNDKEKNIDNNDIDDDTPRSSYRRSCKRSLDKNDVKKPKVTLKSAPPRSVAVTKRSHRTISVTSKNNLDLHLSDSDNDDIPVKFAKVQVETNTEKQTQEKTPIAPPPAKKIVVVSSSNIIKPITCEKSIQCETDRSEEDKFFDVFKPYVRTMNARQRIVLAEHFFKAIVAALDDCRDFNDTSTPVANEISKKLFKDNLGTKEMHLVNEMVNLIQATKHTPESVIVSPQSKKAEEKTIESKSESTPKLIVRKPIELRSNGSVFSISTPTPPGAKSAAVPCRVLEKLDNDNKRRIYRIIPKTSAVNHATIPVNAVSIVNSSINASNATILNTSNTTVTTAANITAPTFSTTSITSPYPTVAVVGTSTVGTSSTTTISTSTVSTASTSTISSSLHSVHSGTIFNLGQQTGNVRSVNWASPSSVVTTSSVFSTVTNRNTVSRPIVSAVPTVKLTNRRFSICDPSVLSRTSSAGISGSIPQIITALPKNNANQRIVTAHPIEISNGHRVRPVTLYDNQNTVFISAAPATTTYSQMQNNTPITVSAVNTVPSLTPIQKSTVPIVMAPLRVTPNAAVGASSNGSNARVSNQGGSLLRHTAPTIIHKPVPKPTKVIKKRVTKLISPPDNSDSQSETAGIISTDELGPWIKNEPLDELNF